MVVALPMLLVAAVGVGIIQAETSVIQENSALLWRVQNLLEPREGRMLSPLGVVEEVETESDALGSRPAGVGGTGITFGLPGEQRAWAGVVEAG